MTQIIIGLVCNIFPIINIIVTINFMTYQLTNLPTYQLTNSLKNQVLIYEIPPITTTTKPMPYDPTSKYTQPHFLSKNNNSLSNKPINTHQYKNEKINKGVTISNYEGVLNIFYPYMM